MLFVSRIVSRLASIFWVNIGCGRVRQLSFFVIGAQFSFFALVLGSLPVPVLDTSSCPSVGSSPGEQANACHEIPASQINRLDVTSVG